MFFMKSPLHWLREHDMGCSCDNPSLLSEESATENIHEEIEIDGTVKTWEECRKIIMSEMGPHTETDTKLLQVLNKAIDAYQNMEEIFCHGCCVMRRFSKQCLYNSKVFCYHCLTYIYNDAFIYPEAGDPMMPVATTPRKLRPTKLTIPMLCRFPSVSTQLQKSANDHVQTPSRSILKAVNVRASPRSIGPNSNPNASTISTQSTVKNLESDGDSLRSYSPQSIVTDPEDDEPIFFQHDSSQIFTRDVSGKLSEYISNGAAMASMEAPLKIKIVSSRVRSSTRYVRRKEEENQQQTINEIQKNTLSDHCYHLSQEAEYNIKKLQTASSESEEEEEEEEEEDEEMKEENDTEEDVDSDVDVVSLTKKSYYVTLPKPYQQSYTSENQQLAPSTDRLSQQPSLLVNQLHQQSATSANKLTQQSALAMKQLRQQPVVLAKQLKQQSINTEKTPARRPRGRPPGPNSVKRKVQILDEALAPKRIRAQNNQRKPQQQRGRRSRVSSAENDDNKDNKDRRSQHNNMERQRRISLKNLFDELKKNVPEIATDQKVAKVVILKQALTFIRFLNEKKRLVDKQTELKKRLHECQQKRRRA